LISGFVIWILSTYEYFSVFFYLFVVLFILVKFIFVDFSVHSLSFFSYGIWFFWYGFSLFVFFCNGAFLLVDGPLSSAASLFSLIIDVSIPVRPRSPTGKPVVDRSFEGHLVV